MKKTIVMNSDKGPCATVVMTYWLFGFAIYTVEIERQAIAMGMTNPL